MRRYTLGLNGREFVVDVQELSADTFAVVVGGEPYQVTLSGDETLPSAAITPGYAVDEGTLAPLQAAAAEAVPPLAARAPAAPRAHASLRAAPAAGGVNVLNAPMPGVILALHVKVGDKVQRGQQVAVLDAMKMHNFIGAPRAGTVAEVCVAEGQAVGHGEPIVRFASGG